MGLRPLSTTPCRSTGGDPIGLPESRRSAFGRETCRSANAQWPPLGRESGRPKAEVRLRSPHVTSRQDDPARQFGVGLWSAALVCDHLRFNDAVAASKLIVARPTLTPIHSRVSSACRRTDRALPVFTDRPGPRCRSVNSPLSVQPAAAITHAYQSRRNARPTAASI